MTTIPARPAHYTAALTTHGTPEAVFGALTTTAGLTAWWTPAFGRGTEGGELRFDMGAPQGPLVIAVRTARPATTVVWDVLDCPFVPEWAGTTITFDLGPTRAGGCALSFRHHGLTSQLNCYDMCRQGWEHFLPSLRQYVDTGVGNPLGSDADRARRAAASATGGTHPADQHGHQTAHAPSAFTGNGDPT